MREPYEREAGHIAGTRHIELNQLTAAGRRRVERERPVIFYCRVGARSTMAAQAFRASGFEAYSMSGRPATMGGGGPAAGARGRLRGRPLRPVDEDDRGGDADGGIRVPEGETGRGLRGRPTSTTSATGPGFRKVRKGLDVTAFGVNAIVMPPGIESGFHYHDDAGGAVLRAPRRDRDRVRRRHGRSAWRRAASRASTRRPCARSATSATTTPSTCAPAARTATSAATGACPRARSSASSAHDLASSRTRARRVTERGSRSGDGS